jgi:iron complex transport system ATP-binding protein
VEPILTLKDIGFRYEEKWALRGIDLVIHPGEILGVLGPNGSGKSTLLKIMDGILIPQEGEILIRKSPLGSLSRSELARQIAVVTQENHFRFAFSALEVVLMGRFPHLKRLQFEGPGDLKIAYDAIRVTHALELAERSIHELSGGERQRVLIARALAQEPRLILLDEPTSFLDLKYKREIFRLIFALSRDQGLSVALVSHDIDLVAQYCHRIVILKNGAVYDEGEPNEVVTVSNMEAVYECPVLVDKNPASGRPRVSVR